MSRASSTTDQNNQDRINQFAALDEKETATLQNLGIPFSPIKHIDVTKLRPHKYNPKWEEDSEQDIELIQDFQAHGILNALLVYPHDLNRVQDGGDVIAGNRRLRLAIQAGLKVVPVRFIERILSDDEQRTLIVRENFLRREYTKEAKIKLINEMFADELKKENRGGDKKSEKSKSPTKDFDPGENLPSKIHRLTGIPKKTVENYLAEIRAKSKPEKSKSPTKDFDPEISKPSKKKSPKGKEAGSNQSVKITADASRHTIQLNFGDKKSYNLISGILKATLTKHKIKIRK